MRQTLQCSHSIFLFLLFFLISGMTVLAGSALAQTTLSPGELIIVTVNSDGNNDGDKTFDFVPLVDLDTGTEIKFTDAAYDGELDELLGNEGTITYTAPNAISAGTVLTYTGSDENGFVSSGNFNPATAGDNIIVFQGERSDPTFLYGIGWARGSSVWNYDPNTASSNRSDEPPRLSQEDHTILSMGTTHNYQYDASNGLEGTANSILSLVGDETNWKEDDDTAFSALSSTFILLEPPTIAFTAYSIASSENSGTAELTVELIEANGTAVDVDVAFLNGSGTATNGDDFANYTTETVSFAGSDTSGTTKTISVNITDDSNFEGREQAIFQLQNISTGTLLEPSELTLAIEDNDAPDIVFNEINADPGDDANGDGELDSDTDEFIEWVNNEDRDIDISGWVYADDNSDRFTFPDGTVIAAGNAVVLFDNSGDVQPQGNFGGALVFTDGEIGLNNAPEILTLKDANGNIIETATYNNNASGESNVLSPEITGNNYVDHSSVPESGGSLSSPGTKVDGTAFGSRYAIGIRGRENWRMITTPTSGNSFDDLFGEFWMQGISGSNDPGGSSTIYSWSEADTLWTPPANMSDELEPGKGYIVYFFEDDDNDVPGIQGGFPKVVNTEEEENNSPVSVPVTATDVDETGSVDAEIEGWNLLGNPFGTDISVTSLIDALENVGTVQGGNIQVWDHEGGEGQGSYVNLSDGDRLAPFQAFFVKYADVVDATVSFDRSDLAANTGTGFLKQQNEPEFALNLRLSGDQFFDRHFVEFDNRGDIGLDRYDAYKLFSLNPDAINVYGLEENNKLLKNILPPNLEERIEIPIGFSAPNRDELTFSWEGIDELPSNWDVVLIDRERNNLEIDLTREQEYKFSVRSPNAEQGQPDQQRNRLLGQRSKQNENARFVMAITPAVAQNDSGDDMPNAVRIKPNYPNPFNPATTITYELDQESTVDLTVWNIVGQKVATLVDNQVIEAGEHEVDWNASDMPSGMYIAQLEVNGEVYIRKMTLIK